MNIEIKAYTVLIQYRDWEPHYALLGVVADEIANHVTDRDEDFYYYMTQSEFDGNNNNLVGVELDPGTYIRDYDPAEQPDILIGHVIEEHE